MTNAAMNVFLHQTKFSQTKTFHEITDSALQKFLMIIMKIEFKRIIDLMKIMSLFNNDSNVLQSTLD